MNEQEHKNRILLYLDELGPDDAYGPKELSQALSIDLEQIVNCLYSLQDAGFVVVQGTSRRMFLAKVTSKGRRLVKEIKANNESDNPINEGQIEQTTGTVREKWLRQLGFHLDPFLYTDGGNDPHLTEYFYKVDYYTDVLEDTTRPEPEVAMVFGTDGSGKSSLRNAIMQTCREDMVLPIVYKDFQGLLANQENDIQVLDHVKQVMRIAIRALSKDIDEKVATTPRATDQNAIYRNYLWLYVSTYESDPIFWKKWENLLSPDKEMHESLPEDLGELLSRFCYYVIELWGYKGFYILVDPDFDICPDYETAWNILKPLLEARYLLQISEYRVVFKFFLNQRFSKTALQIYWITQRQSSKVFYLEWSEQKLRELLQFRLAKCSDGRYQSLAQFSEESDLDALVIQLSGGKPRELIAICNRIFSLHCSSLSRMDETQIAVAETGDAFDDLFIPCTIVEQALAPYRKKKIESELESLIAQGESSILEFKSTMCYNVKEKKRDREMAKVIAKTLCGFMNTRGGTLVIGVDDDENALGLDDDISTLQKKNEDGFELAFTDIVKEYIGLPSRSYCKLGFESYQGKRICVIEIEKSPNPVFFQSDQGNEFWVRAGNSTRRLDPKEMLEHIRTHFEQRQ